MAGCLASFTEDKPASRIANIIKIPFIPCKLPQLTNGCFARNFCGRAAIRAADQYWLLVGYMLALPYYRIVLYFPYKSYSFKKKPFSKIGIRLYTRFIAFILLKLYSFITYQQT
ncbi:hypothetical protein, partial [Flavobacterium coralii]|uniref:hypothetical protein n=1 Tax=Flavobacterium coralii TaxID=2838017 RepID=UPI0032B12C66